MTSRRSEGRNWCWRQCYKTDRSRLKCWTQGRHQNTAQAEAIIIPRPRLEQGSRRGQHTHHAEAKVKAKFWCWSTERLRHCRLFIFFWKILSKINNFFGMPDPETIWHEHITDLSTSPVILGNHFSTLLSPRKRGIMFLPAFVCLSVCLSVCYHDN